MDYDWLKREFADALGGHANVHDLEWARSFRQAADADSANRIKVLAHQNRLIKFASFGKQILEEGKQ